MHKRRWHIFNFIAFLVLAVANFFIYLMRDDGFAHVAKGGYHQLYHHSEQVVIRKIARHGYSGFVYLGGAESEWRENRSEGYQEPVLVRLKTGKNLYSLESRKGKTVTVGLNFTPSQEYKNNKRKRDDVLEIYYSSVPVTAEKLRPISDWLYIDERSTALEKTQALALIGGQMHIGPLEKSEIKVLKTAGYILQNLDSRRGIPAQFMDSLSPLQRLNAAVSGRSFVWCGDFASIFSYFMNLEGVPTRLVALEGSTGDALFAGHVFNEVYLKESQTWALVDLTSKAIFVKNNRNEFMNTQELFAAHKVNPELLLITTFKGSLLENTGYEEVKGFYDYYFQANSHFVYYLRSQFDNDLYSPMKKFTRYFFPTPTFLVYDPLASDTNARFYLKQALAAAMVLFLLYWLLAWLLTRKRSAV